MLMNKQEMDLRHIVHFVSQIPPWHGSVKASWTSSNPMTKLEF